MIENLVKITRTVRKYKASESIAEKDLFNLVDLARLGGSARNSQPLKYMIINQDNLKKQVFVHLGWAGYFSEWDGPSIEQRPAAYIICVLDKKIDKGLECEAYCDLGIASQNLLLGAAEKGIFGCRIGSFSPRLHKLLDLGEAFKILLVIALGYPAEEVALEEVGEDLEIRYWRDDEKLHHVPKRSLCDIILPVPVVDS